MSVGNLPPGKECRLSLRYVVELDTENGELFRFNLPVTRTRLVKIFGDKVRFPCSLDVLVSRRESFTNALSCYNFKANQQMRITLILSSGKWTQDQTEAFDELKNRSDHF